MALVVDASVVVAAFTDRGGAGPWSDSVLRNADQLAAPHGAPAEVTAVVRRALLGGLLGERSASFAVHALSGLGLELYPFAPFADRIWELRHNVSPYDAWYVAIAEALDAPLATLDQRLVHASGPRCRFLTPQ